MQPLDELKLQNPQAWQRAQVEIERRVRLIRTDMSATLGRIADEHTWFESRLYQQWTPSFDLFAVILDICRHEGLGLFKEHRQEATEQKDYAFTALSALQARACVTAGSVLALLRNGYAQEAYTRWRTMIEFSCASILIRRHRQRDVAERYLLHADIEMAKLAEEMQTAASDSGETFYSEEFMEKIQRRRAELIERFGIPFGTQQGWAAEILHNRQPRIEDLLRAVGWENLRPYYRIASFGVHSTHRGSSYNISLPADVSLQLYGPSNHGLADAGVGALEMLLTGTINFMVLYPSFETFVRMNVIENLTAAARDEFYRIHALVTGTPAAEEDKTPHLGLTTP